MQTPTATRKRSGFFFLFFFGLASVIIGTNLFCHASFLRTTTMVLIGSILYKACVSIAISFGLDAQDMKLITAVLFLAILVLSNTRKKKVRIHA